MRTKQYPCAPNCNIGHAPPFAFGREAPPLPVPVVLKGREKERERESEREGESE